MNSKERLLKIKEQYELFLIECFETGDTNRIPEGASVGGYLSKNEMTEERTKSTLEDDIKQKQKDAEVRRSIDK